MASLYEQLMAAKGSPQAAQAPNTTQMRSAPMNLRSAMRKYAEGGDVQAMTLQPTVPPPPQVSAADINSFVQANLGNPQAIADAARTYGVSAEALANATGYSGQQINDYFGNAGLNPFAPQTAVESLPPRVVDPLPTTLVEPVTAYENPYTEPYDPTRVNIVSPVSVDEYFVPPRTEERVVERNAPVDLGNGFFRTPGGTIIDSNGYPVNFGDQPEDFGYNPDGRVYTPAKVRSSREEDNRKYFRNSDANYGQDLLSFIESLRSVR
jgi:hypothetical protein